MDKLVQFKDEINQLLARYGVKFGIYKNNEFHEQLFPFDPIPRVIEHEEFLELEKGLIQRVNALNCFLLDIYTEQKIVKDGVVPEEFIFASPGFLAECQGIVPPQNIFAHIAGIDLVKGKNGIWYVLEDNLRVPSGASYPMIARNLCRKASPNTFRENAVEDNRNYGSLLRKVMDDVNTGGVNVVFTPGRYNAAFFEHSLLAEKTGSVLAFPNDLEVHGDYLYYKTYSGVKQKVGAIYRRISDDFLDPMTFREDSLIGIPHIMDVYRKGNVALINAPGNGIADDKGIYYFVPKMIEYYLKETPILHNAPTYLPFFEEDRDYVLKNFENLVIKDVAEAGGYGVVFGNKLTPEEAVTMKEKIKSESRRFIAQEVIDFQDMEIVDGDSIVERKADLRVFVLSGKETKVWKSGLTRYTRDPDSFVVNSSQGGGFKDTWILSQ
ncbi:circularly permuted type 2 ATP-grasp protein [Anaerostipes sp.]|uniref:circularly permuted type 2 ATP-grasp protein n=1 Tax=Anaerostipes sp. TaxID=1872530 RepID=UPI00258E3398|nr:circularly permuted type 2 ATP-grasp protein [Anaerostipes sp.]MCI5623363.1 circularly permuted type 2 ATP-grasp protein [Anaerostipes sp.]MDY2726237.1 circularly permuted type 2 ATP-grasp protein [Anaerostipes faecalis]